MTISKAPTNIKPQVQEGMENRPPPLEDAPVHESTSWPNAGKISGNLLRKQKTGPLLPPNYLNNDNKDTTSIISPKPPIKEEPKIEEQSLTIPRTDKCGWGPNCPFCKNQEKEEDWDGNHQKQLQQQTPPQQEIQMPQARCTPDSKLPETPELSEIQTGNIRWLISESVKNLQAVGGRDGKT